MDLVAVDLEDEEDHDDTVRPLPNTVALAMFETFAGARVTPDDAKEALHQGYVVDL